MYWLPREGGPNQHVHASVVPGRVHPLSVLLLPKKRLEDEQLLSFHLYPPMVFLDGVPYFCVVTEMVTDIMNT